MLPSPYKTVCFPPILMHTLKAVMNDVTCPKNSSGSIFLAFSPNPEQTLRYKSSILWNDSAILAIAADAWLWNFCKARRNLLRGSFWLWWEFSVSHWDLGILLVSEHFYINSIANEFSEEGITCRMILFGCFSISYFTKSIPFLSPCMSEANAWYDTGPMKERGCLMIKYATQLGLYRGRYVWCNVHRVWVICLAVWPKDMKMRTYLLSPLWHQLHHRNWPDLDICFRSLPPDDATVSCHDSVISHLPTIDRTKYSHPVILLKSHVIIKAR